MADPNRSTFRDRFFSAWAGAACARPWLVLMAGVMLAVGSVVLTVKKLEFRSDRSELVDISQPFQRRYLDFRSRFPRWDDAVVVVDLKSAATPEDGEAYLAALETRLRADAAFSAVTAGFPTDEAPSALLLTEPLASVKDRVAQMKRSTIVFNAPTLDALLGFSILAGEKLPPEHREGLRGLLQRTASVASTGTGSVLGVTGGTQRLVRPGGSLATVLVSLKHDRPTGAAVEALRAHLAALRGEPRFASIQAGVTGIPVLEADETAQSTRDGELAGGLSLAFIVVLMLIVYRGVVVPLLAAASLLIGVAWSFAWATLAVGHLQLLSITFVSFLMGLGIDVAIHLIARLELVHPDHDHIGGAIRQAFRGVGPGIVTSSITIAAAAVGMACTSFSGVGEMGVIAAGGMVLCTVAILFTFPAMLSLLPRPERNLLAHGGGESRPYLGRAGTVLHTRPRAIVGLGLVVCAAAVWLGLGVNYDTDLQNLMPTGSESVRWQKRLENEDARSVWHAVVLAKDENDARDLTLKLRSLPEVSDVGGVGMLTQTAEDLKAKQDLLQTLPGEEFIKHIPEAGEPAPAQLRRVCATLEKTWKGKDEALSRAAGAVGALSDEQLLAAMRQFDSDRSNLASKMLEMRDGVPVGYAALPGALKETMTGSDGSLLLRVYPRQSGAGVLAPESLDPFVRAVLRVAPEATGPSVQIHESTRLITGAYRSAALYALGAIFLILLLDFRSLGDALCALVPVLMGAALMLAVMRLTGLALNFANLIVMPLIVGIGVGCGVHAVRRWRMQPNDLPPGLAGGSGRAITLTSITTVIGFATLAVGEHRGIRSLGLVMSLGLAMVWAVTILVLPAVLKLRGATRATGNPDRPR